MKTLYTANATSIAGRGGNVETDDKRLSLQLGKPGSGVGTNPEQLFACGYSACFGSAVEAMAKKHGIDAGKITIKAEVNLNQDEEGGFYISASLDAILPSVDQGKAAELVKAAHQICPYSKATRGNIDVVLKANGQAI